ncbi:hypothetical protein HN51_008457 [Arachis hypogaea]
MTSFKAHVDSETSFTFFPGHVYESITEEILPKSIVMLFSSQDLPKIPTLTLMFQQNNSFVLYNPVFVFNVNQKTTAFCLAIELAEGNMGTIGCKFTYFL